MNEIEILLPQQYQPVLDKIQTVLPLANIDTENFNKSSSQFKVATLDVADLTPINSAKHLLAVIQKTRQALEEANISLRRKKLELQNKERELMSAQNDEAELLLIDIDELRMQIFNIEASGRGAVRRLANALDHIYLFQLGINGAVAQQEVTALLEAEQEALNNNMTPTHEGVMMWLNLVADKFEKNPELYASKRNMQTLNTNLILEQ